MKTIWITIRCLTVVLAVLTIYILTQQPKVWCDRESAGIALLKGGYRSWKLRFCDGYVHRDGQWQPIVFTANTYRNGYFSWPKFSHVDVRKLELSK